MTRSLPEGVKQTSGGRFDPEDRYVYFVATNPVQLTQLFTPPDEMRLAEYTLTAVNELDSPTQREALKEMLKAGSRVLLDSGIFNLANSHAKRHGLSHDDALALAPDEIDGFAHLYDLYCSLVTEFKDDLWGVIELDQGGATNKRITRARIESDIPGFVPMPVYHPANDGWDYFDELASQYDRMCCGNVVQASVPERERLALTFYERAGRYPYLWVHLLGYTPTGLTSAMPPQGSCDSSSWLSGSRWGGQVLKFRGMLHPSTMWSGDHRFVYQRGADKDAPTGYNRGLQVQGYVSRITQRSWRDIMEQRAAAGLRWDLSEEEVWW